jgi:hypothetical protein
MIAGKEDIANSVGVFRPHSTNSGLLPRFPPAPMIPNSWLDLSLHPFPPLPHLEQEREFQIGREKQWKILKWRYLEVISRGLDF